jgi:hypothetical protein
MDYARIEEIVGHIVNCIETFSQIEFRYSEPDDNSAGIVIIEIAPAVMEIDMPSEDDGEKVFGFINDIDLLAMQSALDEVLAFTLASDTEPGQYAISLEGRSDGQEVLVNLRLFPFEDARVSSAIQRSVTDEGEPTIRIVPKDPAEGEEDEGDDDIADDLLEG